MAVRLFLVRRLQFRTLLAASSSSLTISHYLRLIALAITDVIILFANHITILVVSLLTAPVSKYPSWSDVHHDFSLVSQYPEVTGATDRGLHALQVFSLYIGPLYSIVFFVFFGLGEEAVSTYTSMGVQAIGLLKRWGLLSDRYARAPNEWKAR